MFNLSLFSRRPQIGWQNVPRYRMTRGVSESCSVVTRDERLGPQVMMIGGSGQGRGVTKLVLSSNQWFSSSPMHHPRRNHACVSLTLNGRPGVVVSGGIGEFHICRVFQFEVRRRLGIAMSNDLDNCLIIIGL